jgi:branched-chain amino acid transport system permease protein
VESSGRRRVVVLEQVVSGLALGCIYALVGIGFSLIYAAFTLPHFAQGDVLMLGGVIGFTLAIQTNLGLVPILMLTVAAVGIIGIVIERLVYRQLVSHDLGSKIISP